MDSSQNPASPYYLYLGESPGMIIVTPTLDESNYYTWSCAMNRVLLSKNKIKFVNDKIKEPTRVDPLHNAWERCNLMVIS